MFCEVAKNCTQAEYLRSECVTNLLVVLLNAALLFMLLLTVVWHQYISSSKKTTLLVRYHEHNSRWVLTLFLLGVQFLEFGEALLVIHRNEVPLNELQVVAPVSSLLCTVSAIIYYHFVEKWNEPKLLLVLFLYWPIAAALTVAKLIIFYGIGLSFQHLRLLVSWSALLAYCLLLGIESTLILIQKYMCKVPYEAEPKYKFDVSNIQYLHPFSDFFSRATFSWIIPLLKMGYRKPLELADLGCLPEKQTAEFQFERFNKIFLKEKARAEKSGRKLSLWKCYWLTFWKTLCLGGLIKIMGDMVALVGPLSISVILAYIASIKDDTLQKGNAEELYYPTAWEFLENGFVMTFVVLVATFLQSTFSNNFNHLVIIEGIHLRTAVQCLVYKKSLLMSVGSGLDTGALVNHMSVDAFNLMMMFSMGHYIWAVPFKIVLLLVLLHMQLGYSSLIGAATIYVLAPIQYYICTLLSRIQKKALDVSDERLKKTTELLQGIKLLKLYGWESMYATLVQNVREKELKILRSDAICVAVNTFLTQTSSIIVTLVTFGLYTKIEGKPLSPSEVFTGLALFNQLTVPLYIIPFVIPMVINAVVSTRRLVDFLCMPEIDLSLPWQSDMNQPDAVIEFQPESGSVLLKVKENIQDSKSVLCGSEDSDIVFIGDFCNSSSSDDHTIVSIKNGYFAHDRSHALPSLHNINTQISCGKLTIVVGPVGSGKSSLLSAILGELHIMNGSMHWNSNPAVAYVPQKPWLINATLKENILFGEPYDGRRYHQVTQACALQPDIDLLPARDLTEIGERGVNLSGGQKQRIALARAFYSPARLIILDDPLSALDAHVGSYVFEHGIKQLLLRRQRTVILVTHKLEFMTNASKVIVMESGTIRKQGSYSDISGCLQDLNFRIKRSAMSRITAEKQAVGDTTRERHKLVRLLSKQSLIRTVSTQDIKPRARLVSLSRQMSHDPSSPLPCHDWGDHDDPLPHISEPEDLNTGHKLLKSMKSVESLRSRSSASSASVIRRSWKCPPSRLNSRVSTRTEDLIEEENEEDDDAEESKSSPCLQDAPLPDGKLIKDEEREKGKIAKKVYYTYMKACSFPLSLIIILLIVGNQAMKMGTDFWLSKWSEASKIHGSKIKYNINETVPELDEYIDTTVVAAQDLQHYVYVYAILSAASILIAFVTNLVTQLTSLKAVKILHYRMLYNIVQCPLKFFDSTPVGRIINRFSADMNTIDKKLPVTLPILLRFILLCVAAILVDVIITPYFLIVVIPVGAVYYFLQHFFRFTSRELQRLDSITKSPIFSHFSETVVGLTTIRAFRAERWFSELIMTCININNTAFILINCANCWLGVSLDYLGGFILFIATLSSMLAAIYGDIPAASVGLAMSYTLLVPIYLNWVVRNLASAEMYMSAVERVYNYSKLKKETAGSKTCVCVPENWPSSGEILFENVSLKYDVANNPVLKNITFTVKAGEKVGICGRTGSGKSSLMMALFRMVDICSGKITVDGFNIADISLDDLRSRLSIIPQESVIFSGTVRENLDPGKHHTDEELWEALEAAQLKHIISSWPGGLEHPISDESSNFSVGQNQLFCLARALIRKSKILIMDEATSSLDPETDKILQDVVSKYYAKCTVLSIAHRVQSIINFDKVVVLEAGRIAEIGRPHELMNTKGSIFASLVKTSQQQ